MQIAERTLKDLGFQEILQALSNRCRTPLGQERALKRPFLEDRVAVEQALRKVDEARALSEEQVQLPFPGFQDIRGSVERAAKGAMLEPRELVYVADALFSMSRTRELLTARAHTAPSLAAIGSRLPALGQLASRIERCFDSAGEISDHASPELRDARDRARGLHRRIKAELDRLLHDERFVPNLREAYFTVRNDRYVVPVNAQHRGEVPGIVHNASQSGQTLFVEPQAMIGLGNDLAIAQSVVLEEERRILTELSELVGQQAARVLDGAEAIAELDEVEGVARLAAELRAVTPTVERPDGDLKLRQLRHPVLVLRGKEVVPNDVTLSGGLRALVISGPNAGGKTVTLTGVGICALMLRAGLPIPAGDGSVFPLYKSIHSTVGDAQDIHKDLSSFSAHLLQLREISERAASGSLVMIDEIAADTDPRQGAALAVAVLEDLITRGAVVLVTTHLEELKALAHMDERFQNARVGFDFQKMLPTYRLQLGASGSSSALEIAERMGLPAAVVTRARALLDSASGPLSKALNAAEEERRRATEELERARKLAEEAERELAAAKDARQKAESERRELELSYQESLKADAEIAAHEVRQLLQSLREKADAESAREAQRQIQSRILAAETKIKETKIETVRATEPAAPEKLAVGMLARHVGLGRDVEVLELSAKEALVAAGTMKVRAQLSDLVPTARTRAKEKEKFPEGADRRKVVQLKKAETLSGKPAEAQLPRCDVRGMRADEALRELEGFLDRSLRQGEEQALIVHGHGTGALKGSIREYLDGSPYVRMFRPGENHEGGDGVTVIALKG